MKLQQNQSMQENVVEISHVQKRLNPLGMVIT